MKIKNLLKFLCSFSILLITSGAMGADPGPEDWVLITGSFKTQAEAAKLAHGVSVISSEMCSAFSRGIFVASPGFFKSKEEANKALKKFPKGSYVKRCGLDPLETEEWKVCKDDQFDQFQGEVLSTADEKCQLHCPENLQNPNNFLLSSSEGHGTITEEFISDASKKITCLRISENMDNDYPVPSSTKFSYFRIQDKKAVAWTSHESSEEDNGKGGFRPTSVNRSGLAIAGDGIEKRLQQLSALCLAARKSKSKELGECPSSLNPETLRPWQ